MRKFISKLINNVVLIIVLFIPPEVGILSTGIELHCITKPTNEQLTNAGYLMCLIHMTDIISVKIIQYTFMHCKLQQRALNY